MPTAPKRAGRLAPAERREQLLDAALRLAARHGFVGLTVDAVAREAAVTRPVIYDAFGDLQGLLLALGDREEARAMADLGAEVIPADPGDRDPEEVLVHAVRGFLVAVRDAPETWRLVLLPPAGAPRGCASASPATARPSRSGSPSCSTGVSRGAPRAPRPRPRPHGPAADRLGRGRRPPGAGRPGRLPARAPRHRRSRHARTAVADPGTARAMTSAPHQPGRARVPLAERREQVLDLALEVLVAEGFDALTMEAIARRADVNRVVVYRAFANKGVLLVALLRRERARTERQIDALMPADPGSRDPRAVLLDGLTGFLDAVAAAPLTWHLALLPPESAPRALRVLVDRRRAAVERRIRRLVAWGAERLDVPAGALDLEVLSRMILSALRGAGAPAARGRALQPRAADRGRRGAARRGRLARRGAALGLVREHRLAGRGRRDLRDAGAQDERRRRPRRRRRSPPTTRTRWCSRGPRPARPTVGRRAVPGGVAASTALRGQRAQQRGADRAADLLARC